MSDEEEAEDALPLDVHMPKTREELAELDVDDHRRLAHELAIWIMSEFEPGFVIIGSPYMGITADGIPYPDSIGVILNADTPLTPSSLSVLLTNLARQLNEPTDKVEAFLREVLNKDDTD